MEHRMRVALLAAFALTLQGCAYTSPTRGFAGANQEIPDARGFLLSRITDLNADERRLIESTEPTLAHANFAVYYYSWADETGENQFVVEAYGPRNFSRAGRVGPTSASPAYAGRSGTGLATRSVGRHSRPYGGVDDGLP